MGIASAIRHSAQTGAVLNKATTKLRPFAQANAVPILNWKGVCPLHAIAQEIDVHTKLKTPAMSNMLLSLGLANLIHGFLQSSNPSDAHRRQCKDYYCP